MWSPPPRCGLPHPDDPPLHLDISLPLEKEARPRDVLYRTLKTDSLGPSASQLCGPRPVTNLSENLLNMNILSTFEIMLDYQGK